MRRMILFRGCILGILIVSISCKRGPKSGLGDENWNVLFIMVDDENPDFNGISGKVPMPYYDQLAQESIVFSKAYCAVPACGPSRTAILTGLSPNTTGVYYNSQNLWAHTSTEDQVVNLPGQLKRNGYLTACFGKIYHQGHDELTKEDWDEAHYFPFNVAEDLRVEQVADSVLRVKHPMYYSGVLPNYRNFEEEGTVLQDTRNVNRFIDFIGSDHEKPFFAALGIYKPHGPWYVPEEYYDRFPLDSISIPEDYLENDLDDVPECAKWLATHRGFHDSITNRHLWKRTLRAYSASVAYADHQLGRALEALNNSRYSNNTLIVFIGDNGFHLGQKNHWSKYTLWDTATRVPMLVKLPKKRGAQIKMYDGAVSLLDIYPTLMDYLHLGPPDHSLDGVSLARLLRGEKFERNSVVATYGRNCNAVINDNFYYIRYRDGSEELYNVREDPSQWHNLAKDSSYSQIKSRMSLDLWDNPSENIADTPALRNAQWWDDSVFEKTF